MHVFNHIVTKKPVMDGDMQSIGQSSSAEVDIVGILDWEACYQLTWWYFAAHYQYSPLLHHLESVIIANQNKKREFSSVRWLPFKPKSMPLIQLYLSAEVYWCRLIRDPFRHYFILFEEMWAVTMVSPCCGEIEQQETEAETPSLQASNLRGQKDQFLFFCISQC